LQIKRRNGNCFSFEYNCRHSHLNRTKEEAEGIAVHRRARFGGFDTKGGIQASSAVNETTATFDLTHKRDKSKIIYQKLIKNRHPN
jgi:hypothetical protein